MKKKQEEIVPRLKVRKGATLREIYKAAWEQFTAADLQKFTEIEPMVPAEQVLAEMEAIYIEELARIGKRKNRNRRSAVTGRHGTMKAGKQKPVSQRRSRSMKKKNEEIVPRLKVRKGATLKEIYKAAKEQFTAADLQKFTEIEPMVPMEEVLADMERVHKEELKKMAEEKKKGRKRSR